MIPDVDAGAIAATVKRRLPSLDADLAGLFQPGVASIGVRWPDAAIPAEFADHVADCLARQSDPASAAARLHVDDLFVAWWASTGSSDGLAAFEAAYGDELARIAHRFRDQPSDELRQQLRIKLFVGPDARIRGYSGVGPLLAWLRVVAVRAFVDLVRSAQSHKYSVELDENELLGLPASNQRGDNALTSELGTALKQAFADAVARLAPRQRAFLRHAYVDRLTLDQIADTYSIHRATVARTLASARAQLIEQTREGVIAKLGVAPSELASAIGTLDRQLELSLSRILKAS
jgi:RNA polymerase sigma-70 factor